MGKELAEREAEFAAMLGEAEQRWRQAWARFLKGSTKMQTRGTYPEISVPKPKGKPKGGKCGKK